MRRDIEHQNGAITIKNGDFVISQSDQQHIADIFMLHKGELKEFPELGFGAVSYLKSSISKTEFKRNLKVELAKDGYQNVELLQENPPVGHAWLLKWQQ